MTPPPPGEPVEPDSEAAEGAATFLAGMGFFDLSTLNRRLAAAGYERLDNALPVLGGEAHAVFDTGFVIGGRGAGILSTGGGGPGAQRTHFSGGFGLLDAGFAPVRARPLLITFTGGIGGYGLSLDISDEQSARFDDVLRAPARGTSLGTGGLLVGVTLGIDGRVPVGPEKRGRRGFFTLGIRAGLLYGLPTASWGLPEGARASAGPRTGLTGGFVALAIGFGGGVTAGARRGAGHGRHMGSH